MKSLKVFIRLYTQNEEWTHLEWDSNLPIPEKGDTLHVAGCRCEVSYKEFFVGSYASIVIHTTCKQAIK